ncbi:hypothetical protein [Undibacterium sp. TJN19]|uniref:hypothetical protein n=1 Tax=Undibacterium sp. TJN19 TaxID=3413055 RepID=UPI003BF0C4DC
MKIVNTFLLTSLLLAVSYTASAGPVHLSHPRVSVGISINPYPLHYGYGRHYSYGPRYYYPYAYSVGYYPELIVAPAVTYVSSVSPPTTTIYSDYPETRYVNETTVSQPGVVRPGTSASATDWLYCHQPDGFYPAIKSCPGGWQRVPATPGVK